MTPAGPSDNVTVVPPGGDIQGALDDVAGRGSYASTPWGVVKLQAGETYEVSETIELPGYSVLDFNGAKMVPTENVDVVDVSAASQLRRPFIDAEDSSGWDATLLKVTTRVKKVESIDPVYVDRMFLRAPEKQGTGVKIIDSNGEGLWSAFLSGIIQKGDVGLHLTAENQDSWVNTCFYRGVMRNQNTGILMEEDDDTYGCDAHRFDVSFQPSDTDWFWDLQAGERNKIRANVWDPQYIQDGTIWRIGEDSGRDNVLIDEMGGFRWDNSVVENKIGGAPNGAGGTALFNWAEAMAHLDMKRSIDDNSSTLSDHADRLDEIESQLENS